jgi:hypothetical protein
MSLSTLCPSCSRIIAADADGRLPPWCRHCGAEFKKAPATARAAPAPPASSEAAVPAAVVGEVAATAPGRTVLNFFHACEPAFATGAHRHCRIYVTGADLLVFEVGRGDIDGSEEGLRRRRMPVIGIGAMAAVAVAVAMMREAEQDRLAARIQELDDADERTLRRYAELDKRAFIAGPDDVAWARIDPRSLWIHYFCGIGHQGVLKLAHRTRGRHTFVLPAVTDVRRAAEALMGIFGESLRINIPWAAAASRSGLGA